MSIFVANRRTGRSKLEQIYGESFIIDATSKSSDKYIRLSPFYPHGSIPVPFTENTYSESVEGIWQGLKVFEREDTDASKFSIKNMKNIKRSSKSLGKIIGHRTVIKGKDVLDYIDAKSKIYIPTYFWMLKNHCYDLIEDIRELSSNKTVILLDYNLNENPVSNNKPVSHAFLCKLYIDGEMFVK